jgi:hypothetical protein
MFYVYSWQLRSILGVTHKIQWLPGSISSRLGPILGQGEVAMATRYQIGLRAK